MILSVDEVEERFYSNLPVREDEMVEVPFVINDGITMGRRVEPAKVYYDMLRYASLH